MSDRDQQVEFTAHAAKHGLYDDLVYAHRSGFAWHRRACDFAAQNGHLDCLVYLFENVCRGHPYFDARVAFTELTCESAAHNGKLECLKYCIGVIKKFAPNYFRMESSSGPCDKAAENGHLDCLKYAHENGCRLCVLTMLYAASSGQLECLIYARTHGCHWHESVCAHAAASGQLKCLRYAREHGCPWNSDSYLYAIRYNHVDCIKYLVDHGCPWDSSVCAEAASSDNLDLFEYLRAMRCPMDEKTAWCVVEKGLDRLRYVREKHECPWDSSVYCKAASHGFLDVLRYAYDHGCPVPTDPSNALYTLACDNASCDGHLDCLVFLHEHGFPWNSSTCLQAIYNNHVECVVYALEHGCPCRLSNRRPLHGRKSKAYVFLLYVKGVPLHPDDKYIAFRVKHSAKIMLRYMIKRRARERMSVIRHELVQKTWHPSRFMAWCWDEYEKRDFCLDTHAIIPRLYS